MNTMNTMNTQALFKFSLDTSSKKIVCPGCGQRRAVRYKNNETGEFFPDNVCRCDRENSCGYHYTPKQYLTDLGAGYSPGYTQKENIGAEQKIDYMPNEYVQQSMAGYDKTNFASYLITLFGFEIARKALSKYFVGRSRNDNGKACIFWRIDQEQKVRTGKIMVYNPETGKRNKEIHPTWVHSKIQTFNYLLCFFGEHLITEYSNATIGIVESEKTAIIASIFMPDIVWLATGGNSGCKWKEYSVYKVLQNRKVILFPDFGFFNKKTLRTCYDEWTERASHIRERLNCKIKVSRILEDKIAVEERVNDYDLADMLIKQCDKTGLCLSDYEYPAIWDL
jgi:hypothetical protein